MHILTVSNVHKSFGKRKVLDDLYLSCRTGEIIGFFGRNGSGKSTLLKIIFGTVKANEMSLQINNVNLLPEDVVPSKKIGYLPQDPFLPKGMKVQDVIPLFYKGDDQDKIFYSRNIHKISQTIIGNLSMGEMRYLELLLIGHLDHQFLLLDEPFSMVQPLYKEHITELLQQLKMTKGILITDHYYRDVLSVSDSNIIIKEGKAVPVTAELTLRIEGYLPT